MPDHEAARASTTDGLPVAPSLGPALQAAHVPHQRTENNRRIVFISAAAIVVAFAAGFAAIVLMKLIGFITNLSFFGRLSTAFTSPAGNHLGLWVIAIPVIGGLIIGIMSRFLSPLIRGDGIPDAMENVLVNNSRIRPRLTILKPLSAAIVIGTGGPFGAEGPIIATGGAIGSLIGQLLSVTADERKILLSAGAAGGLAATFGAPVSGVLLAIELLLFEYRARSLVPVALAAATAAAVRIAFYGTAPIIHMPSLAQPSGVALAMYIAIGAVVGLASVYVTKGVHFMEDSFEKLPVHWMWWPAIGSVVVGVVGYLSPHTLGVGYDTIDNIVAGHLLGVALLALVVFKWISWTVALGSGTSGGTLAPLFTMGGGLGSLLGAGIALVAPAMGIDPRLAALVGMAAMFAGASRALLASIVFAFEATHQMAGLLPLLAGCSAAYCVSLLMMRSTIMTEKLARRGRDVEAEYSFDYLSRVLVREIASPDAVVLRGSDDVEEVRDWMASRTPESTHQGFPVVDEQDRLIGVVSRGDLLDLELPIDAKVRDIIKRAPVIIYEDNTAREAADHMVLEQVGRLPVVHRSDPLHVIGILTRSDIIAAHAHRLDAEARASRAIALSIPVPLHFGIRRPDGRGGSNGGAPRQSPPSREPVVRGSGPRSETDA